jgi:hypothetical protein
MASKHYFQALEFIRYFIVNKKTDSNMVKVEVWAQVQHAKSVPPNVLQCVYLQPLTHHQCAPVLLFLVQNRKRPDPFYPVV